MHKKRLGKDGIFSGPKWRQCLNDKRIEKGYGKISTVICYWKHEKVGVRREEVERKRRWCVVQKKSCFWCISAIGNQHKKIVVSGWGVVISERMHCSHWNLFTARSLALRRRYMRLWSQFIIGKCCSEWEMRSKWEIPLLELAKTMLYGGDRLPLAIEKGSCSSGLECKFWKQVHHSNLPDCSRTLAYEKCWKVKNMELKSWCWHFFPVSSFLWLGLLGKSNGESAYLYSILIPYLADYRGCGEIKGSHVIASGNGMKPLKDLMNKKL